MTTNLELYALAKAVLSPEEFEKTMAECFLAAYHKLPAEEQTVIEDEALKLIVADKALAPADALSVLGHTARVISLEVPAGQIPLFAL